MALWNLVNSRPVCSLMLSSYLFLCLPCLLPPFTVPCKMVLARPNEWETWPYHCSFCLFTMVRTRSEELRTRKLKSHLVRTQSWNILPLKPGVGQYIAIHATFTARDFFLAYFYPSGPFTCIFPEPLPISPVLAVANTWFLCRPAE